MIHVNSNLSQLTECVVLSSEAFAAFINEFRLALSETSSKKVSTNHGKIACTST
jgi:hypothetical protein